jgi:tetratricopeptide (TPR) repeat protein
LSPENPRNIESMAKTKTKTHPKHGKDKDILHSTTSPLVKSPKHQKSKRPIEDLLSEAAALLEQSQPDIALPLVEEALRRLEEERQQQQQDKNADSEIDTFLKLAAEGKPTLPVALSLEAEIQMGVGEVDAARTSFLRATAMDSDGVLISAEPWLWLAQLSEGGGRESISYFTKATEVLRNEIEVLEDVSDDDQALEVLNEKRSKLADALAAMTEVYMTDLSWESDAEQRCESYITEAVAICPDQLSAGVLQTLASVRISQERLDDARQALKRSMEIWKDIPFEVESESRPDFATRISLSRLLMEVEAEAEAYDVLQGLIREDDQSVESWYLGGWCQVLIAQKVSGDEDVRKKSQEQAKTWLDNCLRLFRVQQYEDDRLRDHASELVQQLNKELGIEDQMDDDDAWEDDDEDEDEDEDEDDEEGDGDLEVEANGHRDGDVEMT